MYFSEDTVSVLNKLVVFWLKGIATMLLSSHQARDACHSRLTEDNKRYIRQNMHVLCNLR